MTTPSSIAENGSAAPPANPGQGWTNGDVPHSMFPVTRAGRLHLYSTHRRWIGTSQNWTRIAKEQSEFDHRHSVSHKGESLSESLEEEGDTVRSLIAQLCENFYRHGWATGTGGGLSIRTGGPTENRPWRVFVAPSGLQKEDMIGDDIFELDMDRNVVVPPKTPNLKQSACTPLWYVVYRHRPHVHCVIHTHSIHAQMATLLDPSETSKTLKITHLEMLKGCGHHAYDDILEIPIIDNRPSEDLLADQLEEVIQQYPKCNAVLVRRHGVYVWGDSWEQAKTQCESFDYLFESAVRMRQMGLDYAKIPAHGTYRVDQHHEGDAEPPSKRAKIGKEKKTDAAVTGGFHGKASAGNDADLHSNVIPILPRDGQILLLDIEGCTTAISFVKETLFPYVLEHLDDFLKDTGDAYLTECDDALEKDVKALPDDHPVHAVLGKQTNGEPPNNVTDRISQKVTALMKHDVKATGLKALQGKMWKKGYDDGRIKGHVYSDFCALLEWCKAHKVSVNIYSSGSIQAQKLLFGKSEQGDLTPYLNEYFDTTSGSKKEASSYRTISKKLGVDPSKICFVSDAEAELVAARKAGIGHAVMSIRPGNVPLTSVGKEFPAVHSLLQLCGE